MFRYPPIEACPHFLKDIKPIPYRPFRWGSYQCVLISLHNLHCKKSIRVDYDLGSVTMGISNMPWNDWIEVIFYQGPPLSFY